MIRSISTMLAIAVALLAQALAPVTYAHHSHSSLDRNNVQMHRVCRVFLLKSHQPTSSLLSADTNPRVSQNIPEYPQVFLGNNE